MALISSGGSVLVAVTALVLNYRGFASLKSRMLALETRMDRRLDRLEDELRTFKEVVNGKLICSGS